MVYLIYTIDDCIYCDKAKELLSDEAKVLINCTTMLTIARERNEFVNKINNQVGHKLIKDVIYFPIIFHNGLYVGGFKELKKHMERIEMMNCDYVFELDEEF
jgi:glutaredoxin